MAKIFCDLDDTIVDCFGAALRLHGYEDLAADPLFPKTYNGAYEVIGITHKHFWDEVENQGPAFWYSLPYMPHGIALLNYLFSLEHEVHIASRVIGANGCKGKWDWAEEHLPAGTPLHLTTDKSALAAPGRLLIDDSEDNVEKWVDRGGDAVLAPAPWNHNWGYLDNGLNFGSVLPFITSEIRRLGYGRPQHVRSA